MIRYFVYDNGKRELQSFDGHVWKRVDIVREQPKINVFQFNFRMGDGGKILFPMEVINKMTAYCGKKIKLTIEEIK